MKRLTNNIKKSYWTACRREYRDPEKISRGVKILSSEQNNIEFISQALNEASALTRFKILYLIYRIGDLCACDIQELIDISLPAVSQHLTKLREQGLIESYRRKRTIYVRLSPLAKDILTPIFSILKASQVSDLRSTFVNETSKSL